MANERIDARIYQTALVQAIKEEGIEIPLIAGMDPQEPNPWLVATIQINEDSILDNPIFPDKLKPDETSSHYGVHLVGHYAALPLSQETAFFIFKKDELAREWLVSPSWQWNIRMNRIADMKSLDLETVGDGLEANHLVQKSTAVYYPLDDLATIPEELDIRRANLIMLDKSVSELIRVPELPRTKIKTIDTNIKLPEFIIQ